MPTSYNHKSAAELAFNANKIRLHTEGRLLLAGLMNEVINEMSERFNDALVRGEILELEGSRDELRAILRTVSQRQLGSA